MATMTAPSAPPPLHLVLGDEELLVERAVRDVVDAARAADPEVEVPAPARRREATPADLAARAEPVAVRRGAGRRARGRSRGGQGRLRSGPRPRHGARRGRHGGGPARGRRAEQGARGRGAQGRGAGRALREAPSGRAGRLRPRRGAPGPRARSRPTRSARSSSRSAPTCATSPSAAAQLVADTGGAVDAAAVRRYHRGRAEATGFAVADKVVAGDRRGRARGAALGARARRPAGAGRRCAGRRRAHPGEGRRRRPRRPEPARRRARHAAVEDPEGAVARSAAGTRTRWWRRPRRRRRSTRTSRARRRMSAMRWSGPCCGCARPGRSAAEQDRPSGSQNTGMSTSWPASTAPAVVIVFRRTRKCWVSVWTSRRRRCSGEVR